MLSIISECFIFVSRLQVVEASLGEGGITMVRNPQLGNITF